MTTHRLNPVRTHYRGSLVVAVLGLLLLFLAAFEQGQLLGLLEGQIAHAQELMHEAMHDARHVVGMPCD